MCTGVQWFNRVCAFVAFFLFFFVVAVKSGKGIVMKGATDERSVLRLSIDGIANENVWSENEANVERCNCVACDLE